MTKDSSPRASRPGQPEAIGLSRKNGRHAQAACRPGCVRGGCDVRLRGCGEAEARMRAGIGSAVPVPGGAAGSGRGTGPRRRGRRADGQRRRPGGRESRGRGPGRPSRPRGGARRAGGARARLGRPYGGVLRLPGARLFEALPLPCLLPEQAALTSLPYIRPLLAAVQRCPDYRVAIADREHARVLSVSGSRVETMATQVDRGPRSSGFGGGTACRRTGSSGALSSWAVITTGTPPRSWNGPPPAGTCRW